MKQNKEFFLFMGLWIIGLLLAALIEVDFNCLQNMPMFIVSSLTAVGTCGVTILSVFPYKHSDKLRVVLYNREYDGQLMLKVINKTEHHIRLGYSNLPMSHSDNVALWWKKEEKQTLENARSIIFDANSILVLPPKSCLFFELNMEIFSGYPIKDIVMQVCTNTGYKCNVENFVEC